MRNEMEWTEQRPNKPGIYWCRVSGYGTLFPHGDSEHDMIVEIWHDKTDKFWTLIEIGGDCMYEINDALGISHWSNESIEKPIEI